MFVVALISRYKKKKDPRNRDERIMQFKIITPPAVGEAEF